MREFIAKHSSEIVSTLSGFDRLVFRGTLRSLSFPDGMRHFLHANDVLLKDFGRYVEHVSGLVKQAATQPAERYGRPVEYLASSQVSKEEIARSIMARDDIREGLVCVLSAVEPCWTFEIFKNRESQKLELKARRRKCLFIYQYWMHPQVGFMNARIQTWFPFAIQICMNGRAWLARQMDQEGRRYIAAGNCFPWVEDWTEAQRLLDQQLKTKWPELLNPIAEQLNSAHQPIFEKRPTPYYWSTYQSEWAIDVVFQDAAALHRLYPRLVHHAVTSFGCKDVLRYLGKRTLLTGAIPRSFAGDVVSSLKERQEGVRIKHTLNGNSVKLYDKAFTVAGSVLRAETTIQNGSDFRAFRAKEGDPDGPKSWRPLRRGIADIHRRADLSKKATERYLDAFAAVDDDTTIQELITQLQKPAAWRGRRVRALRPFAEDSTLFSAIMRSEFAISGLRNRDLQAILFSTPPSTPREARRRSAWITRKLTLLRAHGLIIKVQGTHRYQLTNAARTVGTAIAAALQATIRQLVPLAA